VLVYQPRAGELGGVAVAKNLGEPALVVVEALRGGVAAAWAVAVVVV